MKTYIALFLPTEGEIKEGDTIQYRNGDTKHYAEYRKDYYDKYDDVKKVKLTLVSRNIQPGDVLKECFSDGKERTVDHFETVLPHGIWEFTDGEFLSAAQTFKVVAEISPKAVWVKEYDEFDEDELEIEYKVTFKKEDILPDCTVTVWKHPDNLSLYWKHYETMRYFPERSTPDTIVGHQNHDMDFLCHIPRSMCVNISRAKIKNTTCQCFH